MGNGETNGSGLSPVTNAVLFSGTPTSFQMRFAHFRLKDPANLINESVEVTRWEGE
jgi:hypothetical protein